MMAPIPKQGLSNSNVIRSRVHHLTRNLIGDSPMIMRYIIWRSKILLPAHLLWTSCSINQVIQQILIHEWLKNKLMKWSNPKFTYLHQDNWRGNFWIKYNLFYFKNKTTFYHFIGWEPFWLPSLFIHTNTPTCTHTQTHAHPPICPHTQYVNRCSISEEALFYVANGDMFPLVPFSKSTYKICWFFNLFTVFVYVFL